MVEMEKDRSSNEHKSICTVSREVNMVTPFSTAQRRMATPSS